MLAVVVIAFALALLFSDRLGADFWPLDNSRIGPNLVASGVLWVLGLLVLALLWPPTRRWIHHQFSALHDKLDWHHSHQHEHNAWMAKHLAEIHRSATGKEPEPHPHHDISKP